MENIRFFDSSDLLNLLESVNDLVESHLSLKNVKEELTEAEAKEPVKLELKLELGSNQLAKELEDTSGINL